MAKKERLQKEIDRLERYAKFYLNILLAILSGIVGVVYAVLIHKVEYNALIIAGVGLVVAFFISLKVKFIDKKQNELL